MTDLRGSIDWMTLHWMFMHQRAHNGSAACNMAMGLSPPRGPGCSWGDPASPAEPAAPPPPPCAARQRPCSHPTPLPPPAGAGLASMAAAWEAWASACRSACAAGLLMPWAASSRRASDDVRCVASQDRCPPSACPPACQCQATLERERSRVCREQRHQMRRRCLFHNQCVIV